MQAFFIKQLKGEKSFSPCLTRMSEDYFQRPVLLGHLRDTTTFKAMDSTAKVIFFTFREEKDTSTDTSLHTVN